MTAQPQTVTVLIEGLEGHCGASKQHCIPIRPCHSGPLRGFLSQAHLTSKLTQIKEDSQRKQWTYLRLLVVALSLAKALCALAKKRQCLNQAEGRCCVRKGVDKLRCSFDNNIERATGPPAYIACPYTQFRAEILCCRGQCLCSALLVWFEAAASASKWFNRFLLHCQPVYMKSVFFT
jgi:hypothetical protein